MGQVKVVRPEDQKKTISGAGDKYRFLVTGPETAGHYFCMEAVVPPGGGPPPHIQTREEEGFYVLEGEVVFSAGGQRLVGTAGTFLHVPRSVVHCFKNESNQTARMLIFFAPAGIEVMMEKMAANPDRFIEIGKEYGVEFVDEQAPR